MTLDKIENLEQYLATIKNGKAVLDFIKNTDLSTLPDGATKILGDDLYVNMANYNSKVEIGLFEAHKDYIDLQYMIKGVERMDYAPLIDCTPNTPYDKNGDYELVSAKDFSTLIVKEGNFAIFFPQDAHRPSLAVNESAPVKKAIFKIKI